MVVSLRVVLLLAVIGLALAKVDISTENDNQAVIKRTHEISKRQEGWWDIYVHPTVVWDKCKEMIKITFDLAEDVPEDVLNAELNFGISTYYCDLTHDDTNGFSEISGFGQIILWPIERLQYEPEVCYVKLYLNEKSTNMWVESDRWSDFIQLPSCGDGKGDPHLTTFDGMKYNFQGFCTHILTQDCVDVANPSFQITADFRAKYPLFPHKPPTRMEAITINKEGHELLKIRKNNEYLINGIVFNTTSAIIGNSEGTVEVIGKDVHVELHEPALTVTWNNQTRAVMIGLNDPAMNGNVCGLLGNANGDRHDDFVTPDGRREFNSEVFGNSWTVPGSCP